MDIRIKYHSASMPKLVKRGSWIDLCVCDIIGLPKERGYVGGDGRFGWELYPNDVVRVSLGVSMELPSGYEAIVVPRSSLFLRHGLLFANSVGVIDNDYSGDNDIWGGVFLSTRRTFLLLYERILQFRIFGEMCDLNFIEVNSLGNKDRGGFGSTGRL